MRIRGIGGDGAECSGNGEMAAGLSEGVLAADDLPLSSINAPREGSSPKGDGTDMEASGLPVSGELWAHCFPFPFPFPFLSLATSFFSTCLVRNALKYFSVNWWQSVLSVFWFLGMRLHPNFMPAQCWQGPVGSLAQTAPACSHRSHCHFLLALSQLTGR